MLSAVFIKIILDKLIFFSAFVYAYCTEFIINLANIFQLSYYEINFIFFCVLYPLLIITLPLYYLFLKYKLKNLSVKK